MGQSAKSRAAHRNAAKSVPSLSVFPTNLGWFGLVGESRRLVALLVGHASADDVRSAARNALRAKEGTAALRAGFREHDWHPDLRRRLERYCLGERVDFDDVLLELAPRTGFQERVLKCVRRIGYGRTISYGELAQKAGH